MSIPGATTELPPRLVDIKRQITQDGNQEVKERLVKAWGEVLEALSVMTAESEKAGPEYIPQVDFNELKTLSKEAVDQIKMRGAVVIRNVVDDAEALEWKEWLKEYVKKNEVDGFPDENKQFFQLYWTKSQVKARSHPNVLAVSTWLNNLYHAAQSSEVEKIEGLSLDQPLSYADRFRIRFPGGFWDAHKPHIDGGGIERWEDLEFRKCFDTIFAGSWKSHDPYDLTARLNAKSSLYGRPNQSTVFRTFQGWMALSHTGPDEGTLRIFPNVLLSNAYLMLRPFFALKKGVANEDILKQESWEFDISRPVFPGILWNEEQKRFFGPRITDEEHPHLRLGNAMVSVPRVNPGDMVFWHCDVVHSVEPHHHGPEDSSVLYIPAVPTTPANRQYIARQAAHFKAGLPPPDFPQDIIPETGNIGVAVEDDIVGEAARRAMGLTTA